MINKLLVAVDGSSHSLKAVDYASAIAACCKASVIILTVVKVHMVKELSAETRAYAKLEQIPGVDLNALKMIAGELVADAEKRSRDKGVGDVVTKVREGPIARTIVECAQQDDVDMIVVGSRGFGNIESTLRGGVSLRVELLAKCPVLTVK
jgi:nucleotide-binding universal stress UspA family protein